MKDLYDFCSNLKSVISNTTIQAAATDVQTAITNVIIAERHSDAYSGAFGISIYFPDSSTQYYSNYEGLLFPQDTSWDELLNWTLYSLFSDDDEFEDNDVIGSAASISPGYYETLRSQPGDRDFFKIYLDANTEINVSIFFEHDSTNCDIDLYLLDTDQSTDLEYSISETDNENVVYTVSSAGLYYIEIFPYNVTGSQTYDLWINATYPDDIAEENDYTSNPYDLDGYVNTGWIGSLTCNDDDFYSFSATEGDLIYVYLWYYYDDGNPDIYLYDPDWDYIGGSATDQDEIIELGAEKTGTYYLWVSPQEIASPFEIPYTEYYWLWIEVFPIDDLYEENDFLDEAVDVTEGIYQDLVCIDSDLFNITLDEGSWLNVTILFNHSSGDLDLFLYNSDLELVGLSGSYTDNEMILYDINSSGEYIIEVDDYEDNFNYTLLISYTNLTDDAFEQNEWVEDAANLNFGQSYTGLAAWDWDFYNITIPASTYFAIEINLDDDQGDLDLWVYNSTGDLVFYSANDNEDWEVVYGMTGSVEETYSVLVHPFEYNPTYSLNSRVDTIPQSSFSMNPITGQEPLSVSFTDTSTSVDQITSWEWNFGDGSANSTAQNPVHVFSTDETYTVTLTVTDIDGDTSIHIEQVLVLPDYLSFANFTMSVSEGMVSLLVQFNDSSTSLDGIASWYWDFGDGITNSTEQNPTHTFTTTGNYNVVLVITDNDGDESTKTLLIQATASATAIPGYPIWIIFAIQFIFVVILVHRSRKKLKLP